MEIGDQGKRKQGETEEAVTVEHIRGERTTKRRDQKQVKYDERKPIKSDNTKEYCFPGKPDKSLIMRFPHAL